MVVVVVAVLVIVGDCSVDSCCSGTLSSLVIDESGSCTCSTIIDRCGIVYNGFVS